MVLESWDSYHVSSAGLPSLIPEYISWLNALKDRIGCETACTPKSIKSLQPRYAWLPSDKQIQELYNMVCNCRPADTQLLQDIYYGLKSLKERHTWKPSDEQMDALSNALSLAKSCGEESSYDLRTLYEHLKKLREE